MKKREAEVDQRPLRITESSVGQRSEQKEEREWRVFVFKWLH